MRTFLLEYVTKLSENDQPNLKKQTKNIQKVYPIVFFSSPDHEWQSAVSTVKMHSVAAEYQNPFNFVISCQSVNSAYNQNQTAFSINITF
jgi:hypothetical protein